MPSRSFINILFITAVCAMLAGCTQPLNNRITLGGSYRSPSFRAVSTTQQSTDTGLLDSTPKPRAHWAPTRYIAPIDSVVHTPTFQLFALPKKSDTARIYGRFPTPPDSIELNSANWSKDLLITLSELGRSIVGTPYAIGYLTITGQLNKPVASPARPWKRTQAKNNWSSGYPTPLGQLNAPKAPPMKDQSDD
ncbi:MAG: hypothetical protein JKX70_07440 [Phycisphaerales bacterium]|nr:hypothetical protein [Phycisphaerales bacterium]